MGGESGLDVLDGADDCVESDTREPHLRRMGADARLEVARKKALELAHRRAGRRSEILARRRTSRAGNAPLTPV